LVCLACRLTCGVQVPCTRTIPDGDQYTNWMSLRRST